MLMKLKLEAEIQKMEYVKDSKASVMLSVKSPMMILTSVTIT